MSAYLGRRSLLFLIERYRKHLSGKGPLKRVSCTFSQCESCSAYGLRVAQTGESLSEVVYQIRSRLRRCGEASLYRDGEALYWGELYDEQDVKRFESQLIEARESPATIRAALLHAARVARFQGDHARSLSFARRSTQYPTRGELLVRRGDGLSDALYRRLWGFLCWPLMGLIWGAIFSFFWGWTLTVAACLSLVWSAQIVARYLKKRRYFEAQRVRLQFIPTLSMPGLIHHRTLSDGPPSPIMVIEK